MICGRCISLVRQNLMLDVLNSKTIENISSNSITIMSIIQITIPTIKNYPYRLLYIQYLHFIIQCKKNIEKKLDTV